MPAVAGQYVETMPLTHPFDNTETPPIWRVLVGEYCDDFDYEQAARNFADAINAAPKASRPEVRIGKGDGVLRPPS